MSLTKEEENIYNNHLIISRSVKNQPFKIRQDFSKIDSTTTLTLKKLVLFFNRHQNIKQKDFFKAPYEYYGVDNHFDLAFYITPKALKCYSLAMNKKERQDPDSEESIQQVKDSCSFIYRFCLNNNLSLETYKTALSGTMPILLQHLKDHHINFYIIHALNATSTLQRVESDLLDFFIKDFNNLLNETRINYVKSQRLKGVTKKALDLIHTKLNENQSNS